jgi:hypothetical protein
LRDAQRIGDAPVEECPGCLVACRLVVEPEQGGAGIDAGEQAALGVEIKVGGGVAGRMPHLVDRPVQASQAETGMLGLA